MMNKRKEVNKRRNVRDQISLCPKEIMPVNKINLKSFFTHCKAHHKTPQVYLPTETRLVTVQTQLSVCRAKHRSNQMLRLILTAQGSPLRPALHGGSGTVSRAGSVLLKRTEEKRIELNIPNDLTKHITSPYCRKVILTLAEEDSKELHMANGKKDDKISRLHPPQAPFCPNLTRNSTSSSFYTHDQQRSKYSRVEKINTEKAALWDTLREEQIRLSSVPSSWSRML